MIAAAVSLLATALTANANWSIVVTRTGHVAARKALADSIAQGVQAQPHCALGVYVPPAEWKIPPKNGADLAGCSTSACLERLAREAGLDRLVALRLNQGFEAILVQASVVEVASSALTEFEATQVAEGTLEADGRRVAEMICARLPRREMATSSEPQTAAALEPLAEIPPQPLAETSTELPAELPAPTVPVANAAVAPLARPSPLSPPRFRTGPLVCATVSASALVASGVFVGMGARQATIVRDTVFPNLEERNAATTFGKAMNVGAYASLGVSAVAAGVGTALWLLDGRRPQLTFQVLAGNGGAHAAVQGEF